MTVGEVIGQGRADGLGKAIAPVEDHESKVCTHGIGVKRRKQVVHVLVARHVAFIEVEVCHAARLKTATQTLDRCIAFDLIGPNAR